MLWGDWNVCVIETPRSSLDKISCTRQFESKLSLRSFAKSLDKRIFSKITPSLFFDKASCTRQFESELSLHSLASLFPLKEGSTSHLGLLPSGKKRETALLGARNRFALRLADHQRSSPCYAGWDRLAVAGGDLMLHQSPRHILRDGTALLKVDKIIEVLVL